MKVISGNSGRTRPIAGRRAVRRYYRALTALAEYGITGRGDLARLSAEADAAREPLSPQQRERVAQRVSRRTGYWNRTGRGR